MRVSEAVRTHLGEARCIFAPRVPAAGVRPGAMDALAAYASSSDDDMSADERVSGALLSAGGLRTDVRATPDEDLLSDDDDEEEKEEAAGDVSDGAAVAVHENSRGDGIDDDMPSFRELAGVDGSDNDDDGAVPEAAAKKPPVDFRKWGCLGQVSTDKRKSSFEKAPVKFVKAPPRHGLTLPPDAKLGKAKPMTTAPPPPPPRRPPRHQRQPLPTASTPTPADEKDDGTGQGDSTVVDGNAVVAVGAVSAPSSKGRVFKFDEQWKQGRPWLRYADVNGTGRMWCSICVDFFPGYTPSDDYCQVVGRSLHKTSVWEDSSQGCLTLRLAAVEAHERANGPHQFAYQQQSCSGQAAAGSMTAAECANVDTTDENRPFFSLYTNAYVCAANNLSAYTFVALNDADKRKGTPMISRYCEIPMWPCLGFEKR